MARRLLFLASLLLLPFATAAAPTNDNDDSCDIALLPAATLLLPYFEVDVNDRTVTTLLSITNVTNLDRIAHVTLWTDRAYPVVDFNIYLTGYDVQSINLFDVIARGIVAPDRGTGTDVEKRRPPYSDPNPALDLSACAKLPGLLDDATLARMRGAFTEGVAGDCAEAGGTHEHAVGYATIDVVGSCTAAGPAQPEYWTRDLRWDNALTGDYQFVDSATGESHGAPMVHIRAVPEGGTPETRRAFIYDAGFERTFYGRYQPTDAPRLDGRQPLPSRFAARWIDGGPGSFHTSLNVWREAAARADAACADVANARFLDASDVVVFDEDENAVGMSTPVTLAATSRTSSADDRWPQLPNGAAAGWMYLDLDAGFDARVATQNWVVSTMRAPGGLSTAVDAAALGNGCSAPVAPSAFTRAGGSAIAPAPNESGSRRIGVASRNNDDSCDIAQLPAATLLLPHFAVDLTRPDAEQTLFTVTNTGPREQIARVTLWTDYGFPVIAFNAFLTGYDVQSISLYDVIHDGRIAARACDGLPRQLSAELIQRLQEAFTLGRVADLGDTEGCEDVGNEHTNAVGYATIDVVSNCADHNALDAAYWTNDIAFDNVLIGDYQAVNLAQKFAQGSPMVHIRAIPEAGTRSERRVHPSRYDAGFARTFYQRHQSAATPHLDARQPLPSTFAARWIQGGPWQFETIYKIWREGAPRATAECGRLHDNNVDYREIIRFDEAENPVGDVPCTHCFPPGGRVFLPMTSRTSVADASIYPQLPNGAIAGWTYLNLDADQSDSLATQNWVVTTMRAEGRFSVDTDTPALGNGCSPPVRPSEITIGTIVIGPAPNGNLP
jgi:hypothetical protein